MTLPWPERMEILRKYTHYPSDLTFAQQLEKMSLLLEWEALHREELKRLIRELMQEQKFCWDSIKLTIACEGPYEDGCPWEFGLCLEVLDSQMENDYELRPGALVLTQRIRTILKFPVLQKGRGERVLVISPFDGEENAVMVNLWELASQPQPEPAEI